MANQPRPFTGLLVGAAAGLIATAAAAALSPRVRVIEQGADDAETHPVPAEVAASTTSRLVVGAVIGGVYGLLAEYRPEASEGFAGAYGAAASALFEDPQADDEAPAATSPYAAILAGLRHLLAG